uniref:DDE_Tnp_1_7 domain-containing protein n=1 Tax=Loa loa TaxID=7209 RepID=A0A1I7V9Q2_LOALO
MLREMYLANRKNIVACRPVVADMGKMSLDAEDKRRGCIVCSVVKNRTILDFSLSDVSTLDEWFTNCTGVRDWLRLISSHNGITARNQYLIIDKIAYLGSCETKKLNKEINEEYLTERNDSIMCTKPETYENFVWAIEKHQTESSQKKQDGKASKNTFVPRTNYSEWIALSSTTTSDSSSTDFTHLNYCEQLSCNFEVTSPHVLPKQLMQKHV